MMKRLPSSLAIAGLAMADSALLAQMHVLRPTRPSVRIRVVAWMAIGLALAPIYLPYTSIQLVFATFLPSVQVAVAFGSLLMPRSCDYRVTRIGCGTIIDRGGEDRT